jgi:hypothetical protein
MNRLHAVVAILALTGLVSAQTVGIPGVNDLTINGQGSGMASMATAQVDAGDPWTTQVSTYPFAAIVGAFSTAGEVDALIIDPVYSVDLVLANIEYFYDGTGVLLPSQLSPFAIANSAGQFISTMTTSELYRVTFAQQLGVIHPGFPNGLGTTQAFDVSIQAHSLLPNAAPIPVVQLSDDGSINFPFADPQGFVFYGTTYTDVYVNMNGNLTFISGSSNWIPSEVDMLSQQPRIAPAWDDWVPSDSLQGSVRVENTVGFFAVEWNDVRTWNGFAVPGSCGGGFQDSNTFSAVLHTPTGQIQFGYAAMILCQGGSAPTSDQVVGLSPGFNGSFPNNIDLSDAPNLGASGLAMYEDFGQHVYGEFDFSHLTCCLGQYVNFNPVFGTTGYDQIVQ